MSEASNGFRTDFDLERQDIERQLSTLSSVPKANLSTVIDSLVQRIHALEKTVTEKIAILTPYDARVCVESIKSMSEQLSQLRTQLVPKPKFSFKSRKTTASPVLQPPPSPDDPVEDTTSTTPRIDQTLFMKFENRSGEHLFIGSIEQLEEKATSAKEERARDVALANLTDCTVNLVHSNMPLGAIHIRNLKRCTLVIPPVSGSILLHDCEGCILIGACHQSRMHTSSNMDIYLHVTSEPIIEDCTNMRFAPYGPILPPHELNRLFEAAQLNPDKNLYANVKDFNWLRQQQSPNWRLLDLGEIKTDAAASILAMNQL